MITAKEAREKAAENLAAIIDAIDIEAHIEQINQSIMKSVSFGICYTYWPMAENLEIFNHEHVLDVLIKHFTDLGYEVEKPKTYHIDNYKILSIKW